MTFRRNRTMRYRRGNPRRAWRAWARGKPFRWRPDLQEVLATIEPMIRG